MLAVGGHVLGDLNPQCVRMATGLAGGVGETQQEVCGALSGGVLVIGGLLGRVTLDESDCPALEQAVRSTALACKKHDCGNEAVPRGRRAVVQPSRIPGGKV